MAKRKDQIAIRKCDEEWFRDGLPIKFNPGAELISSRSMACMGRDKRCGSRNFICRDIVVGNRNSFHIIGCKLCGCNILVGSFLLELHFRLRHRDPIVKLSLPSGPLSDYAQRTNWKFFSFQTVIIRIQDKSDYRGFGLIFRRAVAVVLFCLILLFA